MAMKIFGAAILVVIFAGMSAVAIRHVGAITFAKIVGFAIAVVGGIYLGFYLMLGA